MSENDDELKRALAENGPFDPRKAAAMKSDLVRDFRKKLRAVERYMWIYLTVCVCVAISAYRAFDRSSSTKSQILFAIVFLVAFESTILIKLWYWVANTKVSLLKEIKLLRLGQPARLEHGEAQIGESVRAVLPRWERIAWYVVLILCALVVPNALMTIGAYKAELLCQAYVTIEPDGSGTELVRMECQNLSAMPMTSFPFNAPAAWDIRWLDEQGRPMPATSVSKDGRKQYTVELPKPLMPGEWFTYTRVMKSSAMAERQKDGSWLYRFDQDYGYPTNDIGAKVLLPEQARSVLLHPEGQTEHAFFNGRWGFVNGRRRGNEHFTFTVEYRLPDKGKANRPANKEAAPTTEPETE